MSLESHPGRRVVTDPLALRALAHPLRLKIYGVVGREGRMTAAEAARQIGISQALASHHLRQLAKYGYVEPSPAGDGRERPWQITSTANRFRGDDSPEAWESVEFLDRYMAEQAVEQLADWQLRREDQDPRWSELAGSDQSLLYLTIEEVAELKEAVNALFAERARRRPLGDATKRPADAVPVNFTLVTAPLRPTASGG
ncbi:winged helix-turn-helix domain-containing protein [Winogradskya humida]|uniref:Transcriptional regulator n=1 Tax=Winogradskya humida TaxID=113566 RepID=A0ABQ3ZTH4_9ACTN|nr:helix-turn-helix domain-containing protein [Actinoplanes humidus]GIE21905.1 transcriptional regulator [Actinoplanes humidus]